MSVGNSNASYRPSNGRPQPGRSNENSEKDALSFYLDEQRSLIDDHDMELRLRATNGNFMPSLGELLKNDTIWRDVISQIHGLLTANRNGGTSANDILKSACSDLVMYAARTMTMVRIGPLKSEIKNNRRYVTWDDGSLRQCLRKYFDNKPVMSIDGVRLPRTFDAWAIERLAGIRITFTDNLADHLRLKDGDDEGEAEVLIFHYATFLKNQGEGHVTLFHTLVSSTNLVVQDADGCSDPSFQRLLSMKH